MSLHVRRGDYATNPVTQKFHGLCSLDYYLQAVAYLAEKLGAIHVFVFSDDRYLGARKSVFATSCYLCRRPYRS